MGHEVCSSGALLVSLARLTIHKYSCRLRALWSSIHIQPISLLCKDLPTPSLSILHCLVVLLTTCAVILTTSYTSLSIFLEYYGVFWLAFDALPSYTYLSSLSSPPPLPRLPAECIWCQSESWLQLQLPASCLIPPSHGYLRKKDWERDRQI